jgi:hypothetical protein
VEGGETGDGSRETGVRSWETEVGRQKTGDSSNFIGVIVALIIFLRYIAQ